MSRAYLARVVDWESREPMAAILVDSTLSGPPSFGAPEPATLQVRPRNGGLIELIGGHLIAEDLFLPFTWYREALVAYLGDPDPSAEWFHLPESEWDEGEDCE